jgi:DNA-binding response OmpR family regulator
MEGFPKLNKKLEAGTLREPTYGTIALDLKSQTVRSLDTGVTKKLGPQEYQILWLLVRAREALLSRSEIEGFLYEDLGENEDLPMGNGLDVQLNTLRNILKDLTAGKMIIENVRNIGWRLKEE